MDKNLVNLPNQVFTKLPTEPEGNLNPAFHDLTFPNKQVTENALNSYKVYKDEKDFVVTEAESASKAMEITGVTNPFKIIRVGNELNNIIDKDYIKKND